VAQATRSTLDSLKDLTGLVQRAEGFPALLAALKQGHSGTVDGAWGSSEIGRASCRERV